MSKFHLRLSVKFGFHQTIFIYLGQEMWKVGI